MTRPTALHLDLITASVELPDQATEEEFLALAHQVCEEVTGALTPRLVSHPYSQALTVCALGVTPEQADALATYVRYLSGVPRRFLEDPEQRFLDAWWGGHPEDTCPNS